MVTKGCDAPIPQRKAILQKFVSEVRIQSRKAIHPVFRLSLRGVRDLFRLVDPGSQNTNPAAALRAGRIDLTEPRCRTGERRDRFRPTGPDVSGGGASGRTSRRPPAFPAP
jgi:hypothetical protein